MSCSYRFDPTRRGLLLGAAGGLALAGTNSRMAFSATPSEKKLVAVILHGGMDGLNVVVPTYSDDYYAARATIAIPQAGEPNGAIDLTDGFGMHPSMPGFAHFYLKGQMAIMHAASAPYDKRSHFDGQDVLENGTDQPLGENTGWLNRALGVAPALPSALGIGSTVTLVLKGQNNIATWAEPKLAEASADTVAKTLALYGSDPVLQAALQGSVDIGSIIGDLSNLGTGFEFDARAAGKIMSADGGPGACALTYGGWDTHANQGGSSGQLANNLANLDRAMVALREELGDKWNDTVVVIATEFGRTFAENGTGGTDHGVGGVSFLLGGAVKGRRFIGDWPGIAPSQLNLGRELYPANDLRAMLKGMFRDHWGISKSDLDNIVFPNSAAVPAMTNLLR
ncbi:MAG: DUF1501 domain-containing protein [Robiginitomaculum sp.]|nr:DUF1501 domain-containing protein [Robiginitomaculum sp.]